MSSNFREIEPRALADNPFRLIGSDWMLITAGRPGCKDYHRLYIGEIRNVLMK